MLSSSHRFHRRNHVQYVHKKGRSVRGQQISLRFVRGQQHDNYRVAVVVSKKVDKRAVVRNRIRRRIYEYLRTLQPPIQPDVDVIVSVFDAAVADMPSAELAKRLESVVKSARLQESDGQGS